MNIIPRPLHYVIKEHAIKLGKSTKITGDFADAVKFAKEFFASFEGGKGTSVKFVKDEYVAEEGYVISTDKSEESVTVSASTEAGAYYALMTIEQSAYKDGQLHCTDFQDIVWFQNKDRDKKEICLLCGQRITGWTMK